MSAARTAAPLPLMKAYVLMFFCPKNIKSPLQNQKPCQKAKHPEGATAILSAEPMAPVDSLALRYGNEVWFLVLWPKTLELLY